MRRALFLLLLPALCLARASLCPAVDEDPLAHVRYRDGQPQQIVHSLTFEPAARQWTFDPTFSEKRNVAGADSGVVTTAAGVLSITGPDLQLAKEDGSLLLVVRHLGNGVWIVNPDDRFIEEARPSLTVKDLAGGEEHTVHGELLFTSMTDQWNFVDGEAPNGVRSISRGDIEIDTPAGILHIDREGSCWIVVPQQDRTPLCIQPGGANGSWRLINSLAADHP